MDDFMNKGEALSRAEFEAWKNSFTELKNKQIRCLAKRTIAQDERISASVRLAAAAFVLGVIAVVLAAVF